MSERAPIRTAVPAALALAAAGLLLTGCGTAKDAGAPGDPSAAPPAAGTTASAAATPSETAGSGTAKAAVPAGSLGGPGTACPLPVSFSLAKDWKPKAVTPPADPDLAELTRQGPATIVCEIDAKPAGNIGFLRVWTAPKGSAKATLEAFVKAVKGSKGLALTDIKAGALPAVEGSYSVYSELLEETKESRTFAVETPKNTLLIELGGMDTEEYREMLPAYELAKSTLKGR
ncbi:lipoprotein [Streptomyces sp. NPDC090025]|uniref:lipoprotein n=1 Tax=Streptomyces sp. NPDC090025 TaxID=3365922 RepID=UPI0038363616